MAMNKIDIVKKHLDDLTKGDWSSFRGTLTDNAVYEEEATQRRFQGADQYIDSLKQWKTAFPDFKARVKECVASGDAVVCEVEWSGTHKGAFSGPMGTIPATNRAGKLPAMIMYRFDGDRIRECHHYFDAMTLLMQLGVMPQPAQPTVP